MPDGAVDEVAAPYLAVLAQSVARLGGGGVREGDDCVPVQLGGVVWWAGGGWLDRETRGIRSWRIGA